MNGGDVMFGLKKYKDMLSVMDDCTDSYMFVFDLDNDYYTISSKALDTFMLTENSFNNATEVFKSVVYAPDYSLLTDDINRLVSGESKIHDLEYRWLDKNGTPVWIACKGKVVFDEELKCNLLVGSIQELGKENKYDNNTNLFSESVLKSMYEELLGVSGKTGFLLLFGVDNFKQINEKYGMKIGDEVLADIANCISEASDTNYRLFKLSGDEFIVFCICDEQIALEKAEALYHKVRSNINRHIEFNNYNIFYTISAGAYCFNTLNDSFEKALHNLKFALHNAKMTGKNIFVPYSEEEYKSYINRMNMQSELRKCITDGFKGFEVYYQPVVEAETGIVNEAEALIRWNSEVFGFMSPVVFIPLLEESSLIIPLGKWIIDQAVVKCKEWIKVIPDFTMNINLSFVQIVKSDILNDVIKCVDYYGIDHRHIVFEATESGELENNISVRNVLKSFNSNSFKLAIDDFGTGYSNLKYIKDLMFNIIKIDRLFIQNIDKRKDNYTLVKYIIEMAHSLGIKICVEGVETDSELDTVMQLKPDAIQGYYFGKPVCSTEFESLFINKKD